MIATPRNNWTIDGVQPVDWLCPLNRGLVAWWLGIPGWTGGRRLIDITSPGPNGNHGTLAMDPATDWVPSPRGVRTLEFDGSADYVDIGSIGFNPRGNSLAISVWAKPARNASGHDVVIGNRSGTEILKIDDNAGTWGFEFDPVGSGASIAGSDTQLNVWVHLALVFNGTNLIAYENGNQVNISGDISLADVSADNWVISRREAGISGEEFQGQIDDVRIWRRGLLASEVKAVYLDSLQGYPRTLQRMRRTIFAAADVAPPTGNPWNYYAQQAAIVG